MLQELGADEAIVNQALDSWIEHFQTQNPEEVGSSDHWREGGYHPRIKEVFARVKISEQDRMTPLEACAHIVQKGGWGALQRVAMLKLTVDEATRILEHDSLNEQKTFLICMLDMVSHRGIYDSPFGSAIDNFIEACRTIVETHPNKRLCRLIHSLFEESRLLGLLTEKNQVDGSTGSV